MGSGRRLREGPRPDVEGGRVVLSETVGVNLTFDCRFVDREHVSRLVRTVKDMIEDPFGRFGPIP